MIVLPCNFDVDSSVDIGVFLFNFKTVEVDAMIIYDLQCTRQHIFEGWFKSKEEFDREKGRLSCPYCGDEDINLLPSGGHTPAREKPRKEQPGVPLASTLKQYLEKNFENVGNRFADEATRMHFGEIDHRNIRGTMTPSEEQELSDEGVQYLKVPVVKYDS